MDSFITVLHIVVALILIGLVLVQDTKSGSVGGAFGGGGSSSVLGATGAATLAQKMTRWTAVIFAVTSIALTMMSTMSQKSVMSADTPPPAAVTPTAATPTAETPATPPSESGK